jgi:hypothetical protein
MTIMRMSALEVATRYETAGENSIGDVKWMAHEAIGHPHSRQPAAVGFLNALVHCLFRFQNRDL